MISCLILEFLIDETNPSSRVQVLQHQHLRSQPDSQADCARPLSLRVLELSPTSTMLSLRTGQTRRRGLDRDRYLFGRVPVCTFIDSPSTT